MPCIENFDKKSALFIFPIATEHRLKLFLSQANKFSDTIIKEDSNEIALENEGFNIVDYLYLNNINPALPLKKEEKAEDKSACLPFFQTPYNRPY